MSNKNLILSAVIGAVVIAALALSFAWFGPLGYGMRYGMHHGMMGYGMHFGFAPGESSFDWGWLLLWGLVRLAFWLIPAALVGALVAWLFEPHTPTDDNVQTPGRQGRSD